MVNEQTAQFWKGVFEGFEEATPLAFGHGDPLGSKEWEIAVSTPSAPHEWVAAWALLQSRNSGERRISLGVQKAGSDETYPVRLDVDEELTGEDYLRSISSQLDEQLDVYPMTESELCDLLQLPPDQQLFSCTIAQNSVCGVGGFSEKIIARTAGHLARLLGTLPTGGRVRAIQHMSEEELDRVLREWNPAPTPYPETTVHALVEKQAVERPDAVAFVSAAGQVSYAELNAKANRLAHFLIGAGVLPGQGVAIFLDRGLWQTVATLAILKAGAGYIPLDIAFPPERISQMLEDAVPAIILSSSEVAPALQASGDAAMVLLDRIEDELQSLAPDNPSVACSPDSLAYIMYTSGSTGRPKGVEVVHRGIVRLLFGVDYLPYNCDTVILHIATVSFDATTFELWGALLHGGTCVLSPSRVPSLELIGKLLKEHRVNTFLLTTAFFNLAVNEAPQILEPVKYLLVGGEALSARHVEMALRELPRVQIINAYGPTENTVISTTHAFDRDAFDPARPIPIGRAIGNSTCYILDRNRRPVPVGVRGELYVGGDGLARGYANRPDLTAERFLEDPFSPRPGARMYRTGDMVYWNENGLIEFVGRTDHQIKLRGFRIEPQEIDAVLESFPGVEQAITVVCEDDIRGKWLAGYVKVPDPGTFSVDELEKYVSGKLPAYMVPSALVPVASWSYTSSGKLDRKALPVPVHRAPVGIKFRAPENDTQQVLAGIWQRLLQLDRVGVDDIFFDIGGDSLRGVHVIHEISQCFGKDVPLVTLNQYPTVSGLAAYIDGETDESLMEGFRCLQLIQKGEAGVTPLFLVHGGAGNVVVFRQLACNLGSQQPVYAFQWSGWDGDRGHKTIAEMAAAYKEELVRFFPSATYRLGGHCIGGLIAVELARQLKAEGIGIDGPIVVSDCPNLESSSYLRQEPESTEATRQAFCKMLSELEHRTLAASKGLPLPSLESPASGWVGLLKRFPFVVSVVGWAKAASTKRKIFLAQLRGHKVPIELRPFFSSFTLLAAAKVHSSPFFDGEVVYFRSYCVFGRNLGLQGWWDDPYMGFREICTGGFEAHVVGGGHNEVLDKPEVAAILKQKFEGMGKEDGNELH